MAGSIEWRKWEQKGEVAYQFPWPSLLYHHHSQIKSSQPSICSPKPPSRPANPALPLPSTPDQQSSHNPTHQRNLLQRLDYPIHASSKPCTIFSRPKEEKVDKCGVPECEEEDEEGLEASAGEKVQVLGSKGGLEDEEIEVDLRWRRGQGRERVGRCVFLFRG